LNFHAALRPAATSKKKKWNEILMKINEDRSNANMSIPLLPDEKWWGGRAGDGLQMPFDEGSRFTAALHSDLIGNQGCPFYISSAGRHLWSEEPFRISFEAGCIRIDGTNHPVELGEGAQNLRAAFLEAARAHFPATGDVPPQSFFSVPQYNTWIEMTHLPSQQAILDYAAGLLESGFPPGILMIDAGWFSFWGDYEFHPGRFPDPKAMMRTLQDQGFQVMLWVSPFVSADTILFRKWRDAEGWFLRDRAGKPAVLEWWDGYSAHLDVTHPPAAEWLYNELTRLQETYGVVGFKFDAGDVAHYIDRPASWLNATPVELCEAWARFGARFPYNEFRACWKCAGLPIVQRLSDRSPTWDSQGLPSLIPNAIAQGLLGHPFNCPDMVGGGNYLCFQEGTPVDEELFIRWAQASSLFPMMQFSAAPWRVLNKEALSTCRSVVEIRQSFVPLIWEAALDSAHTGEPILRSMEYNFPHQGYAAVNDQFLIGEKLLVAPVIERGARKKVVRIPAGRWQAGNGEVFQGPAEITIPAPLETLPHFLAVD
jgi:hypothetical protein